MSVADHDTTAAVELASQLAEAAGIRCIPGIEITAVWRGMDVHVLGYFFDTRSSPLQTFLARQRQDRIRRVRHMASRLAELGMPVQIESRVTAAQEQGPRALGRPDLAAALVEAGHVANAREAFDRYLGDRRAAFLPRVGATPDDVVRLIADAGGISSLAHPGLLRQDALIPRMVRAGLTAIEVYHSKHSAAAVQRYTTMAAKYGLALSGGSDFHGDESYDVVELGTVSLPERAFDELCRRADKGKRQKEKGKHRQL